MDTLSFLLKSGRVKRLPQRGFVLREIEHPTTVGSHSFRASAMGWLLSKQDPELDTGKVLTLVSLHDLVAGHAGDITPYETLLGETSGDIKEVFTRWVRLPREKKEEGLRLQREQERKAVEDLAQDLPDSCADDLKAQWQEFEQGNTAEARFVQQLEMMENFVQALEYWEEDSSFPIEPWWMQMDELIDHPLLLQLLESLGEKYSAAKS